MVLKFGFETILYFICVPTTLLAVYFSEKYSAQPQKNWVLGVVLPFEELDNAEVASVLARFGRTLKSGIIIAFLLSIPLLFSHEYISLYALYLMLIVIGSCIFAEYSVYKYNREIRELKKRNGWDSLAVTGNVEVIDTKASSSPLPLAVEDIHFLIPLAITAVPLIFCLIDKSGGVGMWTLYIVLGAGIFASSLSYLLFKIIKRFPNRVYSEDSETNRQLNKIYKSMYCGVLFYAAVMQSIVQFCIFLRYIDAIHIVVFWTVNIALSFGVIAVILYVYKQRKEAEKKYLTNIQSQPHSSFLCEDTFWKYGIFYYNKNDRRIIVDSPFGINTTFNMARKTGKIIMSVAGVLIIGSFVMLSFMATEEFTVHKAFFTKNDSGYTVNIESKMYKYSFDFADVEEYQFLEEMPTLVSKINGFDTNQIARGVFSVKGYKESLLMINKDCEQAVYIKTGGKNYFYNGKTPEMTEGFYQEFVEFMLKEKGATPYD